MVNYDEFYFKHGRAPAIAMNINANKHLSEAITKSRTKLNHSYCVFNPSSYLNIIRSNDREHRYLNEHKCKTQPTKQLVDALHRFCENNIRNWPYGCKHFDDIFKIEKYDENSVGGIYGNVLLVDFPFVVNELSIEKQLNVISRRALLLGYNYVVHDISRQCVVDGFEICETTIQFEATYFSSNVKPGDFLYHVAPKSLAKKILAKGLVPNNKNNHGFNYGDRVYAFIDKYDEIMKNYASSSEKKSMKFILNGNLKQEVLNLYEKLAIKQDGVLFDSHEFCVFKIDTAKLNSTKFYRDNLFDVDGNFIAVYAVDPIPPKALEIITEFKI